MKVILVDDERLALIGLQKSLEKEVGSIEVIATYMDPTEALVGIVEHRPDVVFLDIHMPEMDGMELGKQIKAALPGAEIIYVTSFDQYAVHAFDLQALDYIMKPVQKDRLKQALSRVQEKLYFKQGQRSTYTNTNVPIICCFNQIQFKLPGKDRQVAKWRTSKAQELFAYLLHHRNQTIHRSALLELMWPGLEEDKTAHQLYTTMYHVRQTLKACGMDTVIIHSGHLETGYRLELGEAQLDTEQWEQALNQWKVVDQSTVHAYERTLHLYKGTYLGNYDYMWAEPERERLRYLWLYHMRQLSQYYMQQKLDSKLIENSRQIQSMLPDHEDSYFTLMKLYSQTGHSEGVEQQYGLLTARLEKDLGIRISEYITKWYQDWKHDLTRVSL